MAGKLSFSIAVNLLLDNFKRGVSSVKNGFRSMQMRAMTFVAALGFGGISLDNFISKLITTARETNRVTTALRNVSGTTAAYANNQRWLLDLAKKYGVEITGLTSNYAKFIASAQLSGIALADQRKIFEAVTRATTAFGMSADDSNGVLLALTQMMSKGKISSEELRLQMGERLPVALQAMAKAAGVPISQLDDLLKKGKLLSADVLPRFADALNEMVQLKDADTPEASINKLNNIFTESVRNSGIKDYYKSLIDWLTVKVEQGANNIRSICYQLTAVLTGVVFGKFFNYLKRQWDISAVMARRAAENVARSAKEKFNEIEWQSSKTAKTIKTAWQRTARSIKAALASIAPALIISGISLVISKLIAAREEAKRIKDLYSSYQKGADDARNTPEVSKLEKLRDLLKETNSSYEERKSIVDQINKELGTNFSIEKGSLKISGDINKSIESRIQLLKDEAELEYQISRRNEARTRISELGKKQANIALGNRWYFKIFGQTNASQWLKKITGDSRVEFELSEQERILRSSDRAIEDLLKRKTTDPTPPARPLAGNEENKKLQTVEEDYAEKKRQYANQFAAGVIKEKEYQRLIDELNKETAKKLAGLLAENERKTNKTYLEAKRGVDNPLRGKTADIEDSYEKEAKALSAQLSQKLISEKDYNSQLLSLTAKTLTAAASLEDIDAAGLAFIEALKNKQRDLISKVTLPVVDPRDTTFDYRMTETERQAADRSKAQERADALRSAVGRDADDLARDIKKGELSLDELIKKYNSVAPLLVEELNKAMREVKSLDDALKIAEVQQDIKDLTKEINQGLYAGVKEVIGGADRLVDSFAGIKDAASGWERMLAIFKALTETADSIISILDTIRRLTELTEKLTMAKQIEAAVDKKAADDKVQNAAIGAMADMQAAAVKRSTATTEVAANTASAASEAGKSAARLPFPANLIAIGSAVGAVLAIFGSLPKFATGGIVQGPTSGDNVLARLNGGEMILNKGQQSTLFSLLNNRPDDGTNGGDGGGQVVFKIKGDELVGVLEKYNRRQKRIR